MDEHILRTWLQAQSLVAKMEAAKIENKMREIRGESPAYGEDWFNGVANQFEHLARNYL